MKDKKSILERYKDYDERLLVNNLLDAGVYCTDNYTYKGTNFLDPRQQNIAKEVLKGFVDLSIEFDGGIEEAERKICCLKHEAISEIDIDKNIIVIEFTWQHTSRNLSHRDFLGSLIGNGIKREMIGDIILGEKSAIMACKSEIADFILLNVNRIGSVPVKAELKEELVVRADSIKIVSTTVASLRLDCIISAGFGISRSKALDNIKGNKVKINWEETANASREVNQNDMISLRGKGRIVLEEISGNTKKDRIKVLIKKFV